MAVLVQYQTFLHLSNRILDSKAKRLDSLFCHCFSLNSFYIQIHLALFIYNCGDLEILCKQVQNSIPEVDPFCKDLFLHDLKLVQR